jgi:hypothetical protein
MTTTKVRIQTDCKYCNGQAYIPIGRVKDNGDGIYTRYLPCDFCQGTGLMSQWISLVEFIHLIETTDVMEVDYQSLSESEPMTQYQDSLDSAGI